MAAGKPVVCLDLGEPALEVTDGTGIKVPITSPEQVVSDLAAAMTRLARDPDLRVRLGTAARRRAQEEFDWDKKGILMTKLYKTLDERSRSRNADRPPKEVVMASALTSGSRRESRSR
jgi:glycosyltransferase involved in cell wall biosynthesis